jgi:hypothetical protein
MENIIYRFTYAPDKSFIKNAARHYWLRSYWPRPFIGDCLLVAIFVYLFIAGDRSWAIGVVGTCVLFLLCIRLAVPAIHYRQRLGRLNRRLSTRTTIVLDVDNILIESDLGTSKLPWKLFNKIWKFNDMWLLFPAGYQYFALPITILDEDIQSFIIQQINQHKGKII